MSIQAFFLDQDSPLPLYQQLYTAIRSEIRNGNRKTGEKLPSKRRLASDLSLSQNTVETAYGQLAAEGYIRAVPRSGFYVCGMEVVPITMETRPREPFIPQEKPAENPYRYDFQTNTVDTAFFPFSTWAKISKETLREENRELLKMPHPQGDADLRESIARYLHAFRGVVCQSGQIVVGAGTEYLLGLLLQILGRDCIYAVENPGYTKSYRFMKSREAQVRLIGLDAEGIRVDALEASDANAVYVTPSHHFPLGTVMTIARRMRLLQWAGQADGRYIIEDDYDSEFRFTGRPIPALQGLDTRDKVIYLSTFSKSIAPSIRISYMVLPAGLLERYRNDYGFYSSTVSRFEQQTLCQFICAGHFERHLNRMRILYRARKDQLAEQLRRHSCGECIGIFGENAGLHLLLQVQAGNLKEHELVARAAAAGVRVYGLSEYYIEPTEDMPDNVVVLGYASFDTDAITEAAALLCAAWFA